MAGRPRKFPKLEHPEAAAALRWLHATGKVTAADIRGALRKREALVREIRARLEALGGESLRFLTNPAALAPRPKRRRKKATAKARAAWRLQGQYLGAVRRLSKANRAKVKATREKSGVRAAIAAAKKMATGR